MKIAHERAIRRNEMDRPVGRAAGGPAAGDRPRPLRRRHQFCAPASHADRALQPRPRQHRLDRHRGRARTARRGRGVDRGRHRRRAADRFPRGADREARAVPPAGAGDGQGALCRRAGGRGVRRGPLRRRGRRRSRHHGGRGTAGAARCARRSHRILVRPRHRSGDPESGLWRRRSGVQIRRAYRRAEAHQRPALRRAAGMPRRARPLRRLARRAGTARRREGAAPEQGADRAHAQPRAGVGAVL